MKDIFPSFILSLSLTVCLHSVVWGGFFGVNIHSRATWWFGTFVIVKLKVGFSFPPCSSPSDILSVFKQSILFANYWMVSKIVASISEEGLGISDASVVFTGGTISSMSAGGWLFSHSVSDRVSSSKSRSVSVVDIQPTAVHLTCWLKRIKIHKLESSHGTPLELDSHTVQHSAGDADGSVARHELRGVVTCVSQVHSEWRDTGNE